MAVRPANTLTILIGLAKTIVMFYFLSYFESRAPSYDMSFSLLDWTQILPWFISRSRDIEIFIFDIKNAKYLENLKFYKGTDTLK